MIEKIKYYKRHLYKSGKFRVVYPLAHIDHPMVVDILLEATKSDKIDKKRRTLIYDALLVQNDPRGHEVVIEVFMTEYQYHHNILSKIHKLQDRRIVPTLIHTLKNFDDIPRLRYEIIISETMQCLAKVAPEEAIPILNQIIETYPFTSEEKLVPDTTHGLMALTVLKEIEDSTAKSLADKWDAVLQSQIKFHINRGTVIQEKGGRIHIPYEMGCQADLIHYMLEELFSGDSIPERKIVSFLGNKLLPLQNQPGLQQEILEAFYTIASESDDISLRRLAFKYLSTYDIENMNDLALASLEFPELRLVAVKILSDKAYPGAVEKIIELLEEEHQFSGTYRYYLRYLGFVGTARTEKKLTSMLGEKNSQHHIPFIFEALASIAQDSNSAFETICQALESQDKNIRKNAIMALGKVGEPAMTILITLLSGDQFQIIEALKALNSACFRNALPYIVPFLSHESSHLRRKAYQTILTFNTEGAFALLNAYETSLDNS